MYNNRQMYSVEYAAACGILNHLNNDELTEILRDDDKLEVFVRDLKQRAEVETEKEMLLASNRSLAEFNLSREPELRRLKLQVFELSKEGEQLLKTVDEKAHRLKKKKRSNNMETGLDLLQTASTQVEEESENIAEEFLRGELDIERFLEQFTQKRKLMHLRRVKADKMSEMVVRRKASQKPAARQNNSVFTSFYQPPPPPASSTPYPLGSVAQMPSPLPYPLPSQF